MLTSCTVSIGVDVSRILPSLRKTTIVEEDISLLELVFRVSILRRQKIGELKFTLANANTICSR